MKITLNVDQSALLVEAKDAAGNLSFNQLITEALKHIHTKYKSEVQYEQKNNPKPNSKS